MLKSCVSLRNFLTKLILKQGNESKNKNKVALLRSQFSR